MQGAERKLIGGPCILVCDSIVSMHSSSGYDKSYFFQFQYFSYVECDDNSLPGFHWTITGAFACTRKSIIFYLYIFLFALLVKNTAHFYRQTMALINDKVIKGDSVR